MSYKLTGLYGLPHGHAVALCFARVWAYMQAHGDAALRSELDAVGRLMGGRDSAEGLARFEALLQRLEIAPPAIPESDLDLLAASVNPERLSNNPLALDAAALRGLYSRLASQGEYVV